MRTALRVAAAVFIAWLVPIDGRLTSSATAGEPPARATCVLSHPAFAGKCTETPAVPQDSTPRQACESVLACLNTVACTKTYCQATTIREGWNLESAK
jgi:hypothetical protein